MGIIKEFLNSLLGTSESKVVEEKPTVVAKKSEVKKPVAEVKKNSSKNNSQSNKKAKKGKTPEERAKQEEKAKQRLLNKLGDTNFVIVSDKVLLKQYEDLLDMSDKAYDKLLNDPDNARSFVRKCFGKSLEDLYMHRGWSRVGLKYVDQITKLANELRFLKSFQRVRKYIEQVDEYKNLTEKEAADKVLLSFLIMLILTCDEIRKLSCQKPPFKHRWMYAVDIDGKLLEEIVHNNVIHCTAEKQALDEKNGVVKEEKKESKKEENKDSNGFKTSGKAKYNRLYTWEYIKDHYPDVEEDRIIFDEGSKLFYITDKPIYLDCKNPNLYYLPIGLVNLFLDKEGQWTEVDHVSEYSREKLHNNQEYKMDIQRDFPLSIDEISFKKFYENQGVVEKKTKYPKINEYIEDAKRYLVEEDYMGTCNKCRLCLEYIMSEYFKLNGLSDDDYGTLNSKIDGLEQLGKLSEGQANICHEVRKLGNKGSHDSEELGGAVKSDAVTVISLTESVSEMFFSQFEGKDVGREPVKHPVEYYTPARTYYGRWVDCYDFQKLMMKKDYLLLKDKALKGDVQAMLDIASGFLERNIKFDAVGLITNSRYEKNYNSYDYRYYFWTIRAVDQAYKYWRNNKLDRIPIDYIATAILETIKFTVMNSISRTYYFEDYCFDKNNQYSVCNKLFRYTMPNYDKSILLYVDFLTALIREFGENIIAPIHIEQKAFQIKELLVLKVCFGSLFDETYIKHTCRSSNRDRWFRAKLYDNLGKYIHPDYLIFKPYGKETVARMCNSILGNREEYHKVIWWFECNAYKHYNPTTSVPFKSKRMEEIINAVKS